MSRIVYKPSEMLALPPKKELIRDLLSEGEIAMFYGPSGIGKSYFIVMLAALLASGMDWFDVIKIPRPVRVGYVQSEGTVADFRERLDGPLAMHLDIEKNLFWTKIMPFDLGKYNHPSIRKDLVPFIQENKIEVLILDSLYSSLPSGSLSSDETVQGFSTAIQTLQMTVADGKEPTLAVIIIHHDHRDKRNQDGNVIDEGGDSFHGSGFLKAMSAQMWQYRKHNGGGDSPRFKQTKGRSRYSKLNEFYVILDEDSGVLSPSSAGIASHQHNLEKWAAKEGDFTTADAMAVRGVVSESAVEKALTALVNENKLTRIAKGRYKWTQGRSIPGPLGTP